MAERPSAFNTRGLLLFAGCRTQTVSSHHGIAMKVEAVSSKRVGGRFNVPGLGNFLEFPFDLDLIRGEMQSSSTELPGDTVGFVACSDNKIDETGVLRTAIGGHVATEPVFDDLWERVRLGPEFRSSIAMKVGPVRTAGLEISAWDRAKDKALYVMDVEFAFLRDAKLFDH